MNSLMVRAMVAKRMPTFAGETQHGSDAHHRRAQHALMGHARPVELLDGILYDMTCLERMLSAATATATARGTSVGHASATSHVQPFTNVMWVR